MTKKHLLAAAAALVSTFGVMAPTYGQTATFTYNDGDGPVDAGSYMPGSSFTFSITLNFTAGGNIQNLEGLSYWFEQQSPNPPFNYAITLRDVTGSQFTFLQTPGLTYPQTLMPQNADDLGAALQSTTGIGNGSYFIANVTISIDAAAAPGVFLIQNTTTPGKRSVISDDQGDTFGIPAATYTITVVPEPGTWSLLALGTAGAGLVALRRRRR